MTPKIIAIATAIAAAVAFSATSADAGDGVRLNFGGPLGSFTATPSRGGGADYTDAYDRKGAARKAAAAAREAELIAAVGKKPPAIATAEDAAPLKTESSKTASTSSTSATSSSGSTALIDTGNQATAAGKTTRTAAIEPTKADEPAKLTETSTSADIAPVEVKKDEPKKDELKAASTGKKLNCKKFIPAIGITVSVSCGD
jgi:hypothetical protein